MRWDSTRTPLALPSAGAAAAPDGRAPEPPLPDACCCCCCCWAAPAATLKHSRVAPVDAASWRSPGVGGPRPADTSRSRARSACTPSSIACIASSEPWTSAFTMTASSGTSGAAPAAAAPPPARGAAIARRSSVRCLRSACRAGFVARACEVVRMSWIWLRRLRRRWYAACVVRVGKGGREG